MSRSVNKADMTVREIIDDLKDGICDYCCKHLEEANLKSKRAHERAKKKEISWDDYDAEKEIAYNSLEKHCRECPVSRL